MVLPGCNATWEMRTRTEVSVGSAESRESVREQVEPGSPGWLCIQALMVLGTGGGFLEGTIVARMPSRVGACCGD